MAIHSEGFRLIYMTVPNKSEAAVIAETIVRERLVACVNMISGVESVYHWEGKICKENEIILVAKTTDSLVPVLIDRITELHSSEIPCVVATPIVQGNPAFLRWIDDETTRTPDIK